MAASILVLASDPASRDQLRWVAEEFGRVVTTSKPAMAIYLAAVHEPRVAIVDFDAVPPGGRSGLVSTLRDRFRSAIVGVASPATVDDVAVLGLAATVEKPVSGGTLISAVGRILDGRVGESADARDTPDGAT